MNNDYDKYSVLMSVYCKENPSYLKASLESMLNQTIKPDEIVLIEDGPLTDELYSVIDKYKDYLKIVKNETNLGLGVSLNKGLKECKNELVARMDTDDISKPNRCEKELELFNKIDDLTIVGTNMDEFVDDISNIVSTKKMPSSYDEILKYSRRRNPFNHPTVMYKKSDILSVGGYSNLKKGEDIDLFERLLYNNFKGLNINESLLYFRFDEDTYARRKDYNSIKAYTNVIKNSFKNGHSSLIDYLIVFFGLRIIYIMPLSFTKFIYKISRGGGSTK